MSRLYDLLYFHYAMRKAATALLYSQRRSITYLPFELLACLRMWK